MSEQYSLSELCRVLGVSRSGYQAWGQWALGPRARQTGCLDQEIRTVFAANRCAYGSPRVTLELQDRGWRCGENRVARRMRLLGLRARQRRRFVPRTTDNRHRWPVAPNRLGQRPAPNRPDQVWVADITYLSTTQGFVYLACVLDRCSRRIVGWSLGRSLERGLVLHALRQALRTRRPAAGCLHHSDRGSQYASGDYQQLLVASQLQVSMSRAGNCYDNAVMESFWSTLKAEALHQPLADETAARQAVFDYIETFYNPKRRHSALGYRSPVDFEQQMN